MTTESEVHPRAAKLDELARYVDLESGVPIPAAFEWERKLYHEACWQKEQLRGTEQYAAGETLGMAGVRGSVDAGKNRAMRRLNRRMRACRKCPGLNCPGQTDCCVPWGSYDADVVVVGQSAHWYAVQSDVPFILKSGEYLDAACRLSGMRRDDLLICNAVACHPERNKASLEAWKTNCRPWLTETIRIVEPQLIVALGNDAAYAVEKVREELAAEWRQYNATHPAAFLHGSYDSKVVRDWIVKLSDQFDKVMQ